MADYRATARQKAKKYGLDPYVFQRQIQQESGFNPTISSPAGAQGIAQIMPATARGWGVDPLDPVSALDAAAKNMAKYVNQYGSYENALRAYNAGPGAIERSKGFAETNNYVQTILRGRDPGKLASPSRGGGSGGTQSTPRQIDQVPEEAAPTAAAVNRLAGLTLSAQAKPQISGPSAPAFTASAPTPTAYQTPVTTFTPKERFGGVQITDALTALQQSQQQVQQSAAQTVKNAGDGVADADDIQTAEVAPNAYAARASKIDAQKLPYSWGGGHAGKVSLKGKIVPLDCSGAVSAVLGIDPRVSGQFESWGKSGRSKSKGGVNVYANDEHVLMEIGGRFFGTSQTNPGGGAGWIPRSALSKGYLSRFTVRHL